MLFPLNANLTVFHLPGYQYNVNCQIKPTTHTKIETNVNGYMHVMLCEFYQYMYLFTIS